MGLKRVIGYCERVEGTHVARLVITAAYSETRTAISRWRFWVAACNRVRRHNDALTVLLRSNVSEFVEC